MMSNLKTNSDFIGETALLKALENTTVYCFIYDVKNHIAHIPQRTYEHFQCKPVYENMPFSFAEDFVYEADMNDFLKMYDDIEGGADTSETLFRSKDGSNWCNVTLTVTERDSDGKTLSTVGIIKDLSKAKNKEMQYVKWLNALGEMYHLRCYINLEENTYSFIESDTPPLGGIPESGNSEKMISFYADNFIYPDDREEYKKKLTKEYICSRINGNSHEFTFEYRQLDGEKGYRWVRGAVILVDALEDGTAIHVLYTAQYIDEEKEEKMLLESSLRLMRGTYYRIGCIDLNRNTMRTLSISNSEESEAGLFRADFEGTIRIFAEKYVLEEYREKFLNIMLPERMKNIFDRGMEYIDISYQRFEDGTPKWARTELIPLKDYSPENRRVMWYVKNISHEKAVEERLTQTLLKMNADVNLQLETILNGISGGFKISKEDEKFTYKHVNESTAALFGYTLDEFIEVSGNCAQGLLYPADVDQVAEKLAEDLSKGDTYSVKYRVKCKDGSLKWIVDSGKRVITEDGERLFYSLYHDVTELEERNIELNNAFTMMDKMITSLSCGIFAYRLPNREILALNNEARKIFDVDNNSNDINITKIMREKIPQEDLLPMKSFLSKLQKPGDSVPYNFRIVHDDGKTYQILANSSLLKFNDGTQFILSSMQDVTKNFELMEVIREERARYRDALLANCEYAYSFDLTEGYITKEFVTKHGVNLFEQLGIKLPVLFDDFIEKWLVNFKPVFIDSSMVKDLPRQVMIDKFMAGNRNPEVEYYSPVTNTYTRVTSLLSQSESNGHIMVVMVGTDTTKSRQSEAQAKQALMDAYEAARRANSAKSDFLSRMSHDIRTPMNAIIGMTAIARTHLDDKERVADCLGKITASSGHLLSLINEVLDMSKIESGKVDLNEEDFSLSDLIDNLITMIRPQIKAKDQKLKVNVTDVVHEKVVGDKLRIQQSFLNLIGNATKYTPEGGSINLYISEKPSHNPKVGRYEFIFEDSGIGMDSEFIKHIFEPFSRASDSRVSKVQGTGLGLAITDNLVRMMNGNIEVESELGKGSRFTVTIMLKLQEEDEVSCEQFIDLPVLVADDDEDACESTCNMLDEIGMKSEWVTDGQSAVDKVVMHNKNGDDYFAVIIDWRMPGMDGLQTTREIRKQVGDDVPIIIISAYDWSDIELEARAAGADAFVGKPLFKSRLARVFNDIISGENHTVQENAADGLAEEDFSGKRVLLVEDNELNAEIAKELIEMTGIEVECAENGQIAVDMFANSELGYYNLVFMDIQMPVMNGNDATKAIRALSRRDARSVPIVAMTANAFSEDVQASLSAGMNEHMAKPLDFKQLISVLRRWLR